jgi:hypothetical protein
LDFNGWPSDRLIINISFPVPVRSPTSASDMATVEFIRVWQFSSYKLSFGSDIGPNPNSKMV